MSRPVFIVPGFQGSGAAHWQSWISERCPQARRLEGVDWDFPDLSIWADEARAQISRLETPVWLVAHSFGCLVSLVVAAESPASVAGLLLVAPADPRRFQAEGGLRERARGLLDPALSVADVLPERLPPGIPSLVLASDNDPWLSLPEARRLAQRWGSPLLNLGAVGPSTWTPASAPGRQCCRPSTFWNANSASTRCSWRPPCPPRAAPRCSACRARVPDATLLAPGPRCASPAEASAPASSGRRGACLDETPTRPAQPFRPPVPDDSV